MEDGVVVKMVRLKVWSSNGDDYEYLKQKKERNNKEK